MVTRRQPIRPSSSAGESKEIDESTQNHGPMIRPEVIERALTKLLSKV